MGTKNHRFESYCLKKKLTFNMTNYYIIKLTSSSNKLLQKDILYLKKNFPKMILCKTLSPKKTFIKIHSLRAPFTFKNSFEKYIVKKNSIVLFIAFKLPISSTVLTTFETLLKSCVGNLDCKVRCQKINHFIN